VNRMFNENFSCATSPRVGLKIKKMRNIFKVLIIVIPGIILLTTFNTCNQEPSELSWPEITNETKPWTRWWWMGSIINRADMTAAMEEYNKAGLGGLEITPIYGVRGYEHKFIQYLSAEWVENLLFTLEEADRLGMGIDMATGTGWPFGGPWVISEDACKNIVYKTYTLNGGENLTEAVSYIQEPMVRAIGHRIDISKLDEPVAANKDLQALALEQVRFSKPLPLEVLMAYSDSGEILDLTRLLNENGMLEWTATQGTWTIYALFRGWHGKMVERAAPGGEGDVIDHFSRDAIDHYLEQFDKVFTGKDIHSLRAFFNDSYEVDDAKGQADWTPELFDEFRNRRGYDLRDNLPALFGRDEEDKNIRVLYDYRVTISELLLENFTIPWRKWAEGKGAIVRNQAHGSPANILDLYAAVNIPETEGTEILGIKLASSAANMTNTFWNDFPALNTYVSRCQSFLQTGRADNDILLYYLFHDLISEPARELLAHFTAGGPGPNTPALYSSARLLQDRGYSFDYISDLQLEQLSFKGQILHTGGTTYKTLILPDCKYIPVETFEKLTGLASKGAVIIVHENLPADVPGWGSLEERRIELKKLFNQLDFKDIRGSDVSQAEVGKGTFLIGDDLEELLRFAGIQREFMVDRGLQYIRRRDSMGPFYFIVNQGKDTIDGWIPLKERIESAGLFDPVSGRYGLAGLRVGQSGSSEVYLQLLPGESCILKTFRIPATGSQYTYLKSVGISKVIPGPWKINFISGGPVLPDEVLVTHPVVWTDLENENVKRFSGTARYSVAFKKPEITADYWLLDLGRVAESARVLLNEREIGTLIGPSYRIVIKPSQMEDNNILEIDVSNLMANRIADLDRQTGDWKKFYNVNFPSRLRENRGPDGLFSAKHWEPIQSGLIGPVTITPMKILDF